MTIIYLTAGLALLTVGGELLIRGASRFAVAIGVPPLVVGLTVVAFGTSAPEFSVSVYAALEGQADLSLGNVVGSNIFNVLFILGVSALIIPLTVSPQVLKFDTWIMVAASVATLLVSLDGAVQREEGYLLLVALVVYAAWTIWAGRRAAKREAVEFEHRYASPDRGFVSWLADIGLIVGGLVLLVIGSRWLVVAAIEIARSLGVSELVIGLTILAVGTSLPEVAASVIAAVRGQRDIAVGNVIGSSIFNILGVLGASATFASTGVPVEPGARVFDIPVMIAVAVACLPIFFTGGGIARWEGALFLAYYAAYTAYLLLTAYQHAALATFRFAMVWFAIPLTAVTLGVIAYRQWRGAPLGERAPAS
jgi:cation:H+ antiporter